MRARSKEKVGRRLSPTLAPAAKKTKVLKTALQIAALQRPKPGTPTEVYRTDTPGLLVRVGARGEPSFSLVYRDPEGQKRVSLGHFWNGPAETVLPGFITLADAKVAAIRRKANGKAGIPEPVAPLVVAPQTFNVAAEMFLDEHVSTLRSAGNVTRMMRKVLMPALGNKLLTEITRDDVREVLKRVKETGQDGVRAAPIHANRCHALAQGFFNWVCDHASERNGWPKVSPIAGLKRPSKNEKSRERELTDAELVKLWHGLETWIPARRDCVRMLMLCGTRRRETARMEWSEVDLEKREWTIPAAKTKNNVTHTVYLSDLAVAILKERAKTRVVSCPYVFESTRLGPVSDLSGLFPSLIAKIGIADARLHDLRRTFASGLQKLGAAPHVIDKALNHSSVIKGVASVYMRATYATERRAATEQWGQHIAALLTAQTGAAELHNG